MARTRQLVDDYYRAVDAGDIDGVVACFAPDCTYERGGYAVMRGVRHVRRFYEADRVIESGRHRIDRVLVDGHTSVATGVFEGVSRSGAELHAAFADLFLFHDDLIQARTTYFLAKGV